MWHFLVDGEIFVFDFLLDKIFSSWPRKYFVVDLKCLWSTHVYLTKTNKTEQMQKKQKNIINKSQITLEKTILACHDKKKNNNNKKPKWWSSLYSKRIPSYSPLTRKVSLTSEYASCTKRTCSVSYSPRSVSHRNVFPIRRRHACITIERCHNNIMW